MVFLVKYNKIKSNIVNVASPRKRNRDTSQDNYVPRRKPDNVERFENDERNRQRERELPRSNAYLTTNRPDRRFSAAAILYTDIRGTARRQNVAQGLVSDLALYSCHCYTLFRFTEPS